MELKSLKEFIQLVISDEKSKVINDDNDNDNTKSLEEFSGCGAIAGAPVVMTRNEKNKSNNKTKK